MEEMTEEELLGEFFKNLLIYKQVWFLPGDDPRNKEPTTTTAFYKYSYKQQMMFKTNRQIWMKEEEKVKNQLHLSEEEYW